MKSPQLTVAIATFNSAQLLPRVLQAIRNQEVIGDAVKIIIVDGGSTDDTKKIAKQYKATILDNPRTEPVYAKYLAFHHATTPYLVYLDHDEVLTNTRSLCERLEILQTHPDIGSVLVSGYQSPPNLPFVNDYINEFGDPFSFFIYRLTKDSRFFTTEMNRLYHGTAEGNSTIFFFAPHTTLPLIELCAAATLIDRWLVEKSYGRPITPEDIPHFFYQLTENNIGIAIHHNDSILHYSSDNLASYLAKIRWRIKNNIFHTTTLGKSGFSGRQTYLRSQAQYRKYFYPLYAFTLIGPVLDAIWLSFTRKNLDYWRHIPLTFYTAGTICWFMAKKALGYKQELTSYDGKKTIK